MSEPPQILWYGLTMLTFGAGLAFACMGVSILNDVITDIRKRKRDL